MEKARYLVKAHSEQRVMGQAENNSARQVYCNPLVNRSWWSIILEVITPLPKESCSFWLHYRFNRDGCQCLFRQIHRSSINALVVRC